MTVRRRRWNRFAVWAIVFVVTVIGGKGQKGPAPASMDVRPYLAAMPTVVDVTVQPNGKRWMTTRTFDVFTAEPTSTHWTRHLIQFERTPGQVEVRRVHKINFIDDRVALLSGDVRTVLNGTPVCNVLRTDNGGQTWSVIPVAPDTLAIPDVIRRTRDGFLYMLDLGGRLWTSSDSGRAWSQTTFPEPIRKGTVVEIDMKTRQFGVCVDRDGNVWFTTNGWKSVIQPRMSMSSGVRPLLLPDQSWANDIYMLDDGILVTDGPNVFYTAMDSIVWKYMPRIRNVAVDDARKTIVTVDADGNVATRTGINGSSTEVIRGIKGPRVLRSDGSRVVISRPDLGAVILEAGQTVRLPFVDEPSTLPPPSKVITGKLGDWAIWAPPVNLGFVDVFRRTAPSAPWFRDTTLLAPSDIFRLVGKDSLMIGDETRRIVYDAKQRTAKPFELIRPLQSFLAAPVSRMRIMTEYALDNETRKEWCDYRLRSGKLQCTEVVDSSSNGVRSKTFIKNIEPSKVAAVVQSLNEHPSGTLEIQRWMPTDVDRMDYYRLLDTLLRRDRFGDSVVTSNTQTQRETYVMVCKKYFETCLDIMPRLLEDDFRQALAAWRTWSKERNIRMEVVIENTSGDVVRFRSGTANDHFPPGMVPWTMSFKDLTWRTYHTPFTEFINAFWPEDAGTDAYRSLQQRPWVYLAVASWLDAENNGRRHHWRR